MPARAPGPQQGLDGAATRARKGPPRPGKEPPPMQALRSSLSG